MDNKALKSIYKPRSGRDSFATIDNCKVHDNSRYAFVETVPSDGGQYDIIKGYDTQADRPVCIKILQGSYAEGYLNSILSEDISANIPLEATALAKLRHPNIVRVLDWCFVDDRSGVVTEWLDGVSLEEYEFYNLEEVFSCLYQLADAVDYMHSQGVYNRDIHPKNVLMSDNTPVIVDFGSSNISAISRVWKELGLEYGYNLDDYTSKEMDLKKFVMLAGYLLTKIDFTNDGYISLQSRINTIPEFLNNFQINLLDDYLEKKLRERKKVCNAKEVVEDLREVLLSR